MTARKIDDPNAPPRPPASQHYSAGFYGQRPDTPTRGGLRNLYPPRVRTVQGDWERCGKFMDPRPEELVLELRQDIVFRQSRNGYTLASTYKEIRGQRDHALRPTLAPDTEEGRATTSLDLAAPIAPPPDPVRASMKPAIHENELTREAATARMKVARVAARQISEAKLKMRMKP